MSKQTTQVICQDIEGNSYQVNTSDLTFRPAVYGVIIKDQKILLSKQWDGYDFPGGGIEIGEPTMDALIREVKEETGFDTKVEQILHAEYSFFKLPFKNNFVHSIHLYYQCHLIGGKLTTEYFDEQEKQYASTAEWVSLDKVNQIKIYSSANVRQVLRNLL